MAAEETTEQLARVAEQLENLTQVLGKTSTGLGSFTSSTNKAGKGASKVDLGLDMAAKSASKMAEAFVSGAGAMYRGEKGMSAFNQSIDNTADAIIAMAGALALLGGPVTTLAGIFVALVGAGAKYVKAANEQSDKLYQAYQGLSKAGAAGSDGLQGVYSDMQKLGLGVQDLEKMVTLMGSSSRDLAALGGSVNQGRKQFANIGQAMEQYRVGMYNLGMTQDDLNEGTMGYIRLQNRMGGTQNRTAEELAESTKKYLVEQDALTRLTGMNRQEQEKAKEEYLSQERFAAAIQQMRQQNRHDEANELMNYVTTLRQHNKAAAQGAADLASGNLQTKAAQQAFRATNGEAMRNVSAIKANQMSYTEAMDKDVDARKRYIDAVGTQIALQGNYNETSGDYAADLALIAAKETGSYEARKKAVDKDQAATQAGTSAEVQRQSEARATQIKSMQATQDFVRMGVEPATKATKAFGDMLNWVVTKLPGAGTAGVTGATPPLKDGHLETPAGIAAGMKAGGVSGAVAKATGGLGRPGAQAPSVTMGQSDLEKMGLKIKQGDVQAAGSKISPKLIDLATKIQSSLPEFAYFSGFNDKFHQEKSPRSKHTQGIAGDFVLSSPPSRERGEEIMSMLKGLGASVVIDEYNNPSSKATAGHIHFQVPEFELGGLAMGPNSGYMAKLHGTEAVIPLDNNQGNFVEMFEEMASNTRTTNMLLEEMLRSQKNSVDVQTKILRVQQ
jgi:hypothetical protein